ncbi:MAG: ElyC/SanA/YdcF family protein, partial [Patescibacteria group bacterium]
DSQWKPDVIVALTYGTLHKELAIATRNVLNETIDLWRIHPTAYIVFTNAMHCFSDSAIKESNMKWFHLGFEAVPDENILEAEQFARNSIEEAQNIKHSLTDAGLDPKRILVISGEIHSRRARLIWKRLFPKSEVRVYCIHYRHECQADHPLKISRSYWQQLLVSIAHYTVLRLPFGFGFWLSRNVQHAPAK